MQTRLSQYGFAARYEGTIGDKAVEEEREASLEVEELGDSGEKNVFKTLFSKPASRNRCVLTLASTKAAKVKLCQDAHPGRFCQDFQYFILHAIKINFRLNLERQKY